MRKQKVSQIVLISNFSYVIELYEIYQDRYRGFLLAFPVIEIRKTKENI